MVGCRANKTQSYLSTSPSNTRERDARIILIIIRDNNPENNEKNISIDLGSKDYSVESIFYYKDGKLYIDNLNLIGSCSVRGFIDLGKVDAKSE